MINSLHSNDQECPAFTSQNQTFLSPTYVALVSSVSHSCKLVSLVLHLCRTCDALVSLAPQLRCSCLTPGALVSLVSLLSGTRVVK